MLSPAQLALIRVSLGWAVVRAAMNEHGCPASVCHGEEEGRGCPRARRVSSQLSNFTPSLL